MCLYMYSHHYHPYHHHITQRVDNNEPDSSNTTQNDDDKWGRCQPATSMLDARDADAISSLRYSFFLVFFVFFFLY